MNTRPRSSAWRWCAAAALVWAGARPGEVRAWADNTGGSAAQFLRLGMGARALGMGEAYGPIAEGPDAIYWNPGGLAQQLQPEISTSHMEMLSYFHRDSLAYAHPIPAWQGALSGSVLLFYQDTLPLTTNANQQVGSFRPHSEVVSLAFARSFVPFEADRRRDRSYFPSSQRNSRWLDMPFHESEYPWDGRMMMGMAFKVITETIYDDRATAVALDGGLLYIPSGLQELRLSLAFRNLGSKERFIGESYSLPFEGSMGAAYDWRGYGDRRLLLAAEATVPYYGLPHGNLGVEYSLPVLKNTRVALRGGFKSLATVDLDLLSGLTAGAGLQYRQFSADFAFQPLAELGNIYRFGFGMRF